MTARFLRFCPAVLLGLVLAWILFRFEDLAALLAPIAAGKHLFAEREGLPTLALQHLALSAGTSLVSLALAFPLGSLASLEGAEDFRDLVDRTAAFGESFPSVALIALLVPVLGYGNAPVAIALALYGILPVLRNTITGLRGVSPEIVDAARGLGMSGGQVFRRVRLPLALPLVVEGFRVSVVTNIAAATIGAAVGAGGLGVPIVSGIRSFDAILILKGSLPVAVLALLADNLLRALEAGLPSPRRMPA
jgi:osmoprotectant transport system permease protein